MVVGIHFGVFHFCYPKILCKGVQQFAHGQWSGIGNPFPSLHLRRPTIKAQRAIQIQKLCLCLLVFVVKAQPTI